MRHIMNYDLMVKSKTRAITSSTDATPIVVTTAANHELTTGDVITIFGHTTNVAANGKWTITVTGVATYSLNGSEGTGAGAGANGTYSSPAPKYLLVEDAETIQFSFVTDGGGSAAITVKAAISNAEVCPDFAKAQSESNQYDYVDIVDLEDNASIDGDTGIVLAGADDSRTFEVNTNHAKWFTVIPTAGTAGDVTVKATLVCEN